MGPAVEPPPQVLGRGLCHLKREASADIVAEVTEELYDIADVMTPLHLKIELWHSQMQLRDEHCVLLDEEEQEVLRKSKLVFPR